MAAAVPRAKLPWMLVAASVLLLVLVLYLMFVNYLPAKQRITSLELELKELYAGEAGLQTKMVLLDQRSGLYERQVSALRVERDALARRIEELERELEVVRSRRR
jgi:hypothetical protein